MQKQKIRVYNKIREKPCDNNCRTDSKVSWQYDEMKSLLISLTLEVKK